MDHIIEAYRSVAKFAEVSSGRILKMGTSGVQVQVTWSTQNLSSLDRFSHQVNYLVKDSNVIAFSPIPVNKNVVLSELSPSRKLSAFISVSSEKDVESQQVVVIGHENALISVDLKAADKHGKVYTDDTFGCLVWSADEKYLAFVAEKRRPKSASFVSQSEDNEKVRKGEENGFRDEWGDTMTGKEQSVVVVVDLTTLAVRVFELPNNFCIGELLWSHDGQALIGVALGSQPYKLGISFCANRDAHLFKLDIKTGNYVALTPDHGWFVGQPRLSPDGAMIVYLRCTSGGPHQKVMQMCLLSGHELKESVVFDSVAREAKIENGKFFNGIHFPTCLPFNCWSDDAQRVVFSTFKGTDRMTYIINVATGTVTELTRGQVLDVQSDQVLMTSSTMEGVGEITLASLQTQEIVQVVEAQRVVPSSAWQRDTWNFINKTPHPNPLYSDIAVTVVYLGPKTLPHGSSKVPLIVSIHGGPHSLIDDSFSPGLAFMASLGYAILCPNYRGSMGQGQDSINSLLGVIGDVDVSDVHQSVLSCLHRFPDVVDTKNIFLFGGSHGGFLVTHLAAQFPDFYRAVVARNPVMDVATMLVATDIPDWTFIESGDSYTFGKIADVETLSRMHRMSPLSRIDSVRIPILVLIGKNDLRVPPSQGINYHKMLKARGVTTELRVYDDSHRLGKVDVMVDTLIHSILWFQKHAVADE